MNFASRGYERVSSVGPFAAERSPDVLAQPTRARLLARLAERDRPVSTAELAAELGLHPSGVRVHLERLRRANVVSRERIPQTLGRPRHGWLLAPEAFAGEEQPDAYRNLACWLARSIPSRPVRLREVERAGRELGRELVPKAHARSAVHAMDRTLTELGFAPRTRAEATGQVIFTLGRCPYREAVRENQAVVCALHKGLTKGLLDALEPAGRLERFVPEDPERAGCLIAIEGLATD